ncbi:MAG: DUF2975 domain-containing protein [Bacteroidota bacterium]
MKSVRIVSSILFALTRILAWGYLTTTLYATIVIVLKTSAFHLTEGGRFEIFYPFTARPFLLGYNNTVYVAEMLMAIGLYGVFFWLLSDVFKTFRQKKLFTPFGVASLSRFYIANLTVPLAVLIVLSIVSDEDNPMEIIVTLHAVIGIFAYFMAAIFRQGVSLQNEQDLYI